LIGVCSNALLRVRHALAFFWVMERTLGNRVNAEVEWNGLDLAGDGSEAYPPG